MTSILKRIEGLYASVMQWNADFDDDGFHNNGSGQERLRIWFRKNVYQNPRLGKLWTEVLASVSKEDEEEWLLIDFTTEWCGREERHGGDLDDIPTSNTPSPES